MNYKWIGAVLVMLSCGGFGFSMAAAHKKSERMLRQLIAALNFMECELQYRLTPLPELCRQAGKEGKAAVREVFMYLAAELEQQISPDVSSCMSAALANVQEIPRNIRNLFRELGHSLGHFDLPGQIKGLESVRINCRRELEELEKNRDVRLRSYQTLGLCAGAALAILFI